MYRSGPAQPRAAKATPGTCLTKHRSALTATGANASGAVYSVHGSRPAAAPSSLSSKPCPRADPRHRPWPVIRFVCQLQHRCAPGACSPALAPTCAARCRCSISTLPDQTAPSVAVPGAALRRNLPELHTRSRGVPGQDRRCAAARTPGATCCMTPASPGVPLNHHIVRSDCAFWKVYIAGSPPHAPTPQRYCYRCGRGFGDPKLAEHTEQQAAECDVTNHVPRNKTITVACTACPPRPSQPCSLTQGTHSACPVPGTHALFSPLSLTQ